MFRSHPIWKSLKFKFEVNSPIHFCFSTFAVDHSFCCNLDAWIWLSPIPTRVFPFCNCSVFVFVWQCFGKNFRVSPSRQLLPYRHAYTFQQNPSPHPVSPAHACDQEGEYQRRDEIMCEKERRSIRRVQNLKCYNFGLWSTWRQSLQILFSCDLWPPCYKFVETIGMKNSNFCVFWMAINFFQSKWQVLPIKCSAPHCSKNSHHKSFGCREFLKVQSCVTCILFLQACLREVVWVPVLVVEKPAETACYKC